MNGRRGKKDQFEIIWVSRCRDVNSYAQYFTTMNWMALPPDEALGARGQMLGEKYKVKSIPTLVLLDDLGNVITTDARYVWWLLEPKREIQIVVQGIRRRQYVRIVCP